MPFICIFSTHLKTWHNKDWQVYKSYICRQTHAYTLIPTGFTYFSHLCYFSDVSLALSLVANSQRCHMLGDSQWYPFIRAYMYMQSQQTFFSLVKYLPVKPCWGLTWSNSALVISFYCGLSLQHRWETAWQGWEGWFGSASNGGMEPCFPRAAGCRRDAPKPLKNEGKNIHTMDE